ncbi:MAG: hypothetical protein RL189_2876 [Pseudomonadota bacterium]
MQGLLYDISPKLTPRTAVFPGDTPLQQETLLSFEAGHHLMLSTLKGTVHLGAHADAPCHYGAAGADISQRDLRRYLGLCQVITIDSVPACAGARKSWSSLPVSKAQVAEQRTARLDVPVGESADGFKRDSLLIFRSYAL